MDAIYSIELKKIEKTADDLDNIKNSLVKCQEELISITNNLDKKVFKDVIHILQQLIEVENYPEKIILFQDTLQQIVAQYRQVERVILEHKVDINKIAPVESEENDSSYMDQYRDGFLENFIQELTSILLESGSYRIASLINMLTAFAMGPDGPNSFVILNPNVASATSKALGIISKGLCAIGFAIDFGSQLAGGESLKDALIKSGAHLGISIAIGAIIGSVLPGPGTVAGAIVGLVVGAVVTYGANTLFDYIYDDPQGFLDDVENCWNKATNVVSNVTNKIGNAVSSIFGNIGTALAI